MERATGNQSSLGAHVHVQEWLGMVILLCSTSLGFILMFSDWIKSTFLAQSPVPIFIAGCPSIRNTVLRMPTKQNLSIS